MCLWPVVESKEENRRKKRALRAQVCLELDLEKHCLRQMRGVSTLLCFVLVLSLVCALKGEGCRHKCLKCLLLFLVFYPYHFSFSFCLVHSRQIMREG